MSVPQHLIDEKSAPIRLVVSSHQATTQISRAKFFDFVYRH